MVPALQAKYRKPSPPAEYLQTAKLLFVPVLLPVPVPIRTHKYGEACGESDDIHLCPITGFEKTGVGDQPAVDPSGKGESDATVHL